MVWFLQNFKPSEHALNKCIDRVSQNAAVELGSLTRNSSKSRAQVSNAIPTYLLKLSLNSLIRELGKWLKLEINPSCEAGKPYLS